MKESTATTIITERRFDFTKAELETLLRREILGGDIQAKIVFDWRGDVYNGDDVSVTAINTITEHK